MAMNGDRMRYQTNKLSFWLCILAIIFNIGYLVVFCEGATIVTTESHNYIYFGIDVLLNILFMLIVFWGSEKTKTYSLNWSYVLVAVALAQIGRIFFMPVYYSGVKLAMTGKPILSQNDFAWCIVYLLLSAAALVASAIICYIRSKFLHDYLAQNAREVKHG